MKFEVIKTRPQMWDNPDDLLRGCMPRFCVVAVRESNVAGQRESRWHHYLGTKEIRVVHKELGLEIDEDRAYKGRGEDIYEYRREVCLKYLNQLKEKM